jgi:hypothetical protein
MMPNYDAGHYFLTVLAPVRPDPELVDGRWVSRRRALRETLNAMPTGERTVATQGSAPANPFARSIITHFARFFVLDDVVYNGRVSQDSVLSAILKINPLKAQTVDRLSTPFLVFVADFDAAGGGAENLRECLTILWRTMSLELTQVFRHCIGFDNIDEPAQFCAYIQKCQVETTMPFNDYWSLPPDLPTFDLKPYIYSASAAGVFTVAGLFIWRPWLLLLGVLALGVTIFTGYRRVLEAARRPFPPSPPPGPGADLPTVLKALTLQREFTQFAIDTQGKGDQELYDAFGDFVTRTKPNDPGADMQPPGVVGA